MPEEEKPITRCVCSETTFEVMKQAGVSSLEEAGIRFQAGLKCGLCRPYLQKMIDTGDVAFAIED